MERDRAGIFVDDFSCPIPMWKSQLDRLSQASVALLPPVIRQRYNRTEHYIQNTRFVTSAGIATPSLLHQFYGPSFERFPRMKVNEQGDGVSLVNL